MKLAQKTEINEDVITVSLNVEELGDSVRDAETEKNQLHNFVRYIEYSQIDFSGNMKLSDAGIPVVVSEDPDGSTIEKVTISDLVNKKYTFILMNVYFFYKNINYDIFNVNKIL